jgi:hypothetical protein
MENQDSLSGRFLPIGKNIGTLRRVIVNIILVTDGTDGDRLNQFTTGQEIENAPHELRGPKKVTWKGFASGKRATLSCRRSILRKREQRNVAQFQVGQIRQNRISELVLFGIGQHRCRVGYYFSSDRDGCIVGSYKFVSRKPNQLKNRTNLSLRHHAQ